MLIIEQSPESNDILIKNNNISENTFFTKDGLKVTNLQEQKYVFYITEGE